MPIFFHILIFVFFIVLQTSVFPYLPFTGTFYDLLAVFIIYLALYCPIKNSLPIILLSGITMDCLSGSPFGLYFFTYSWLFAIVRWIVNFFQLENLIWIMIVVCGGVVLENIIFLTTLTFLMPGANFPEQIYDTVLLQFLWALGTGTFIVLFLKHFEMKLDKFHKKRIVEENRKSAVKRYGEQVSKYNRNR